MSRKSDPRLGRRDFLRASMAAVPVLSSAVPGLTNADAAGKTTPGPSKDEKALPEPPVLGRRADLFMPHAAFRELQLGSVRPEGWLRAEMTKQAEGITGHQPDFCFPFDRRYWDSNERGQDQESRNGGTFWYPWEQMGYWVDGAYRCAKLIDDSRLRRFALEPVRYTTRNPVEGWFLGPKYLFDIPGDKDPGRWPQAVFFRALSGAAEGEGD